jgi:hypothetical protein
MTTSTIKVWLLAVLLCVAHGAMAQSQLPPCQGSDVTTWNQCYGVFTWPDRSRYVGDFALGKFGGVGTFYRTNGMIGGRGRWNDGNLVQDFDLPSSIDFNRVDESQELIKLQSEAITAAQRQSELEQQLKQAQTQPMVTAQIQAMPSLGKRVALVIGNAAYKVHPLRNPRNDADDVSRSLKVSGFEVIDLRDASLTQMRTAIRQRKQACRLLPLAWPAGNGRTGSMKYEHRIFGQTM